MNWYKPRWLSAKQQLQGLRGRVAELEAQLENVRSHASEQHFKILELTNLHCELVDAKRELARLRRTEPWLTEARRALDLVHRANYLLGGR